MTSRWFALPSAIRRGRVSAVGTILAGVALVLMPLGSPLSAADIPAGQDLTVVPPDALGFVHVRVADLWQSEIGKAVRKVGAQELQDELRRVEEQLGVGLAELDRLTIVLVPGTPFGFLGRMGPEDGPGAVLVASTLRPYAREKVLATLLGNRREEDRYRGKTVYTSGENQRAVHLVSDRLFVVAERSELLRPLLRHAVRPRTAGPLSPALTQAAGRSLLVAGASPVALDVLFMEGLGFGGPRGIFWTFNRLQGMEAVTLTVDVEGAKVRLALDLAYGDEAGSRRAFPAVRAILGMAQDAAADAVDRVAAEPDARAAATVFKPLETALADARLERRATGVNVGIALDTSEQLRATLPELAIMAKQAKERGQSSNNLKQIGLAMHNYHDTYNFFPTAITDKQGKPLLSWRVAILPFIEEGELWKQFRLNEPWDSDHNKKLLERMPKTYAPLIGKTKDRSLTFYQGFSGPGAFFDGPRGIRMADITDGTSNTIMIVEAGDPVPWTKPQDIPFDWKKPLPRVVGPHKEGFYTVFCDGSVHFIRRDVDPNTLRAAITRAGGEVFDPGQLTGTRSRAIPRVGMTFKSVGNAIPTPAFKDKFAPKPPPPPPPQFKDKREP